MTQRAPMAKSRPWRRLLKTGTNYGLGPTAGFTNGSVRYEVVPVFGNAVLTVRAKTASQGGTLDIVLLGPDFDMEQIAGGDVALGSLVGTLYSTGAPTQVVVTAGTEAMIQATCRGEGYALIKFTGTGTGTISYCDVAVADEPVGTADGASVSLATRLDAVNDSVAIGAGEAHIGEVGSPILTPSGSFNRPADTTAYAAGDLVANSTTAGSVTPVGLVAARVALGGLSIRRMRLRKSTTSLTNASFRVHAYSVQPTVSNGDNGAWLTPMSGYLGAFDVTMDKAHSDGASGQGVPMVGSEVSAKLASGQTVYFLVEARAAYTPGSGETFTVEGEVFPS